MPRLASRFDLAYPHTKRDLAGHDPNGTLVDDDRGAFYFHKKIGGHGQGVVTRLWSLANDEHVLDTISTCLLYTSPSPRDQRGSRMPSSA